jgi:signal transduction histidine kinase
MIRRLRPAGLDELGLGAALEACVDHWRRRLPGTRFELTLRGELEDLGERLNLALYRLIQEGLTNCSKHARASHIQIVVERGPAPGGGEQVQLRLIDNGVGADARALRGGFGVGGMRERAQLLGGEFAIQTAPGEGYRLLASLPVARARALRP